MLRKAIIDHAVAFDIVDLDEEMLDHFAVVGQWQKVTEDTRTHYTTAFHSPHVPYHIAKGLYGTGLELIYKEDED